MTPPGLVHDAVQWRNKVEKEQVTTSLVCKNNSKLENLKNVEQNFIPIFMMLAVFFLPTLPGVL